jgi:hypothetical protein
MTHRFAFALVRHKVLLRASGFAYEPKISVTKLLAPKKDKFLVE